MARYFVEYQADEATEDSPITKKEYASARGAKLAAAKASARFACIAYALREDGGEYVAQRSYYKGFFTCAEGDAPYESHP